MARVNTRVAKRVVLPPWKRVAPDRRKTSVPSPSKATRPKPPRKYLDRHVEVKPREGPVLPKKKPGIRAPRPSRPEGPARPVPGRKPFTYIEPKRARVPFPEYRVPTPAAPFLARKALLKGLLGFGVRALPWIGWGYTGYEIARGAYDYWYANPLAGPVFPPGSGWTKFCNGVTTGLPYGVGWSLGGAYDPWNGYCNLGGQVPAYIGAGMPALKPTTRLILRGNVMLAPIGGDIKTARYQIKEAWTRPTTGLAGLPQNSPWVLPYVPFLQPIATPSLDPLPRPAEKQHYAPASPPPQSPPPRVPPYMEPTIDLAPNRDPVRGRNERSKPKKRRDEKKVKLVIHKGAMWAGKIFGAYTEFDDFINAVWKAIPLKERTRKPGSIMVKMEDLYKYAKKMDYAGVSRGDFDPHLVAYVKAAVYNVIENQVEDFVIGKANKLANDKIVNHKYWRGSRGVSLRRPPKLPKVTLNG